VASGKSDPQQLNGGNPMTLPDTYRPGRLTLTRTEQKALARQLGMTRRELMELDHVELVELAKVRIIGSVGYEAIQQIEDIADEVMACQQRNPFAANLAADLALTTKKELKQRIKATNRRLGS
jgi:hypothetical protein